MTLTRQLLLPFEKSSLLRFDEFYPSRNELCFETLNKWPSINRMVYLEGPVGSGKTHLSEALAAELISQNKTVFFLSGKEAPNPQLLYDLPPLDCLILDDLDALLGFSAHYEEALFALYNQIYDRPISSLLVTASTPISQLPLKLKDLQSRLQAMLQLYLKHPTREDLLAILKLHSKRLQIKISEPVLEHLSHCLAVDSTLQVQALKRLGEQSLRDKKPLTLASVQKSLLQ